MNARNIFLKLHLYLGLISAVFLIILGLTGSIMAFEADFDHWLNPQLWHVDPKSQALPEHQVVQTVEQHFAPGRVADVQIPRHSDLAQVMRVTEVSGQVFVNPYDGTILGTRTGAPTGQKFLAFIHKFHLGLTAGDAGKLIVSIAGLILCIEVPLGLIVWFRTKRASVQWKGSWFRVCFDLHNTVGLYAAVFLFISALSGVLIGFDFVEPMIFNFTHSSPAVLRRPMASTVVAGAVSISLDRAVEIARQALPNATIEDIQIPLRPNASWDFRMRVPEETSETVHSSVSIDQYSGQVLRVENFSTGSLGYRVIRFNRSIHTGDIWGLPSHILMSISSLLLVVMVATGLVIWLKKLAI